MVAVVNLRWAKLQSHSCFRKVTWATHLQINLPQHTKTTFVHCSVASLWVYCSISAIEGIKHTHTHVHTHARLLLRPVQEGYLRHKTCSLLWLLRFNIFIYVKASLGRKGLMGSHWMLLTQVSGPHVIACFIIRRMVGESFSDYNFHILLQRAVGDRNDQCSTPNISRWNSCPCWKTSRFSVSAVIMVDYSLLNAPHEISVHAAILADSCCIHLWKEIPWRLLKLRKCLCGFSQWASSY